MAGGLMVSLFDKRCYMMVVLYIEILEASWQPACLDYIIEYDLGQVR